MDRLKFGFFVIVAAIAFVPAIARGQAFDPAQARQTFKTAANEHFQMIDDRLAGIESEKQPGAYWLVKVKPKKAGHYSVKYVFKYNDKFYSEGEAAIRFGVGERICDRSPHSEGGIARFCLGDTVILPFRAGNRYNYTFEIKYTYEDPAYSAWKKPSEIVDPGVPKIQNPLSAHLKFIGTKVWRMPNRACCITRVEQYAIFEAVKPGRFNFGVSVADKDGKTAPVEGPDAGYGNGMPVLILDPGTPITYLAGYEDTINYADEKRFSSHSGGTFPTRLLILQPGDKIEMRYLSWEEGDRAGVDIPKFTVKDAADKLPSVEKYPFYVDPEWSYNAFIAEHFSNDARPAKHK